MALPELKEYCLPESENALRGALAKYPDATLFVAGGTFIHGLEARGLIGGIEALVDLGRLGLGRIDEDRKGWRIGAMVRFAELAQLPALNEPAMGALADALACPPAQIMNLATLGGSVAAACPFFDIPAALLALDAKAVVQGDGNARELRLDEVCAGLFENTLESGEYISSIFLPAQESKTASAYLKLETNANDLALVGIAVRISLGWTGKISEARVVLGGGLNATHVRSSAAEAVLNGEKPVEDVFARAAEAIAADMDPIGDHRCSAEYRATIGKVYVRRALAIARERLG